MPAMRKLTKEVPLILEAYRNNQTLRQIADFHGVSHGTIRNILDREGVPLRGRGRRRKPRKNAALDNAALFIEGGNDGSNQ